MDDYISRQAAFEALAGWKISPIVLGPVPSADVRENVRGEWRKSYLDHEAMGERPVIYYCSICNQCNVNTTNFCPNCGADMRGGKQ